MPSVTVTFELEIDTPPELPIMSADRVAFPPTLKAVALMEFEKTEQPLRLTLVDPANDIALVTSPLSASTQPDVSIDVNAFDVTPSVTCGMPTTRMIIASMRPLADAVTLEPPEELCTSEVTEMPLTSDRVKMALNKVAASGGVSCRETALAIASDVESRADCIAALA